MIHPAALQPYNPYNPYNPYTISPDEKLEHSDFYSNKNYELKIKEISATSKEKNNIQNKIKKNLPLLNAEKKRNDLIMGRKFSYDLLTKDKADTHGSAVMHALHLIAPEAELLPIDLFVLRTGKLDLTSSQALTKAIRAAIYHHVDVINLSRDLENLDQEGMDAIKDAVQQGIVVVNAASNDYNNTLWEIFDKVKGLFVKSKSQDLFEHVKGQGLLFTGALEYKGDGEEQIAPFSQIPDPVPGISPHFVLAPGNALSLPIENNVNRLINGTSFAAPIAAGGYLLLKQYALDHGYDASSETLLNIMQESGHNVAHRLPFKKDLFSLNLSEALNSAPTKLKPASKPQEPKTKPRLSPETPVFLEPVAKKPVVIKKPIAKKPVVKKPVAKKPVAKKPIAKKPIAKKPVAKKPVAKKPVIKKPIAKKPVAKKPVVKKPIAKKPVAKKPVAKKPVAKKPVAKKPVAKKPVAKKPVAKKPVAKKPVAKKPVDLFRNS